MCTDQHDILQRERQIIEPDSGMDGMRNVAIVGDAIAAIEQDIVPEKA